MKSLYLRIYLTVVVSLAAFALVAGWMAQRHIDSERSLAQQAWAERAAAWASLLQNSLPDADAPREDQRDALLDWSRRLRLPMALDDRDGQRIATAPDIASVLGEASAATAGGDGRPARGLVRMPLSDGRVLWVLRPGGRLPLGGRPPFAAVPYGSMPAPFGGPGHLGERGERGEHGEHGSPDNPADLADREAPPGHFGGARGAFRDHGPPPRPLFGVGPLPPWMLGGSGLVITLVVLFAAVAAGAWPVVRRLTRRLEALQRGVRRFGEGDLQHRIEVDGDDEVAAVARSFNDAAQRIEELIRAHRSLLANASHEFRSPLARLKMALELMEVTAPERRAALRDEIRHDIRELDELVEEVLLASRLDARSDIEADPVDLLAVAAEEAARIGARLELAPAARQAGALRLTGSERLLRRAVRNLLENARRYGVPDGMAVEAAVELHLDRQRADGGADDLLLTVCDRGPGVPAAEREHIFEPFYRLPGHAERAGGVGLGLSLVRQIAQRHGGSVRCDDRAGGGSCFMLRLPVPAAAMAAMAADR